MAHFLLIQTRKCSTFCYAPSGLSFWSSPYGITYCIGGLTWLSAFQFESNFKIVQAYIADCLLPSSSQIQLPKSISGFTSANVDWLNWGPVWQNFVDCGECTNVNPIFAMKFSYCLSYTSQEFPSFHPGKFGTSASRQVGCVWNRDRLGCLRLGCNRCAVEVDGSLQTRLWGVGTDRRRTAWVRGWGWKTRPRTCVRWVRNMATMWEWYRLYNVLAYGPRDDAEAPRLETYTRPDLPSMLDAILMLVR